MAFADSEEIQIYYDDRGMGEPVILCLPGFTNEHTIFAPLVERLSADYRVLAMDLRGHGKSQASDRDFGFAEMAADALAVIEDSGAQSVIPYAQGQLPWVAIELRKRLRERMPKMIASSWPAITTRGNPLAPGFLAAMEAVQDEARSRETAEKVVTMFVSGAPASVQQQIRNQLLESHGYAQPPAPEYLSTQESFARDHPWLPVRRLKGASQFPTLEVPDETAAVVREFIKE